MTNIYQATIIPNNKITTDNGFGYRTTLWYDHITGGLELRVVKYGLS